MDRYLSQNSAGKITLYLRSLYVLIQFQNFSIVNFDTKVCIIVSSMRFLFLIHFVLYIAYTCTCTVFP